jgi:hypothetical protein
MPQLVSLGSLAILLPSAGCGARVSQSELPKSAQHAGSRVRSGVESGGRVVMRQESEAHVQIKGTGSYQSNKSVSLYAVVHHEGDTRTHGASASCRVMMATPAGVGEACRLSIHPSRLNMTKIWRHIECWQHWPEEVRSCTSQDSRMMRSGTSKSSAHNVNIFVDASRRRQGMCHRYSSICEK